MKFHILILAILLFGFSAYAQTATVIAENANLRGTPSGSGKVVDTLAEGTVMQILKQKGVWFLVQTEDYVGWLHGDTIKYSGGANSSVSDFNVPPAAIAPRRAVRTPPVTQSEDSGGAAVGSGGGYIRGPRGGCFYYTSSGRKQYVDRSLCN